MAKDRRIGRIVMAAGMAIILPLASSRAEEKPSIAAQASAIRAEYEATNKKAAVEAAKARTEFEEWKLYGKLGADEVAFSRRMVDLAATAPGDPASRDALIWVIDKPGMAPWGPYADEFARAVNLLLRHHGEDLEVARMGLQLYNVSSARDAFFEGISIQAKGHEAKGLARLGFARYLQVKADRIVALRAPARPKPRFKTYDDDGKLVEKDFEMPPDGRAYLLHLRLSDPEATRAEAKRLYGEVIKDYGDVPHLTRRLRDLGDLLEKPNPQWNGEALKPADRKQIEDVVARGRKKTLGSVARANLEEMETIAVGKPAPPVEGETLDGKVVRLSDYRGKVVVLVFWGTWCGPCMAEVPHEREMAARYKDRPFAILGVDCDGDKDAARKVMKKERITWPNWNDGDPGSGPIVERYHVRGYPTSFVIDGEGLIRHINLQGSTLDGAVEALLKELEGKGKSQAGNPR